MCNNYINEVLLTDEQELARHLDKINTFQVWLMSTMYVQGPAISVKGLRVH